MTTEQKNIKVSIEKLSSAQSALMKLAEMDDLTPQAVNDISEVYSAMDDKLAAFNKAATQANKQWRAALKKAGIEDVNSLESRELHEKYVSEPLEKLSQNEIELPISEKFSVAEMTMGEAKMPKGFTISMRTSLAFMLRA